MTRQNQIERIHIGLIDSITETQNGGLDIHCSNGANYYLGTDGIYGIGMDA